MAGRWPGREVIYGGKCHLWEAPCQRRASFSATALHEMKCSIMHSSSINHHYYNKGKWKWHVVSEEYLFIQGENERGRIPACLSKESTGNTFAHSAGYALVNFKWKPAKQQSASNIFPCVYSNYYMFFLLLMGPPTEPSLIMLILQISLCAGLGD